MYLHQTSVIVGCIEIQLSLRLDVALLSSFATFVLSQMQEPVWCLLPL